MLETAKAWLPKRSSKGHTSRFRKVYKSVKMVYAEIKRELRLTAKDCKQCTISREASKLYRLKGKA